MIYILYIYIIWYNIYIIQVREELHFLLSDLFLTINDLHVVEGT